MANTLDIKDSHIGNVHTKDKKFRCDRCSASFADSSNLSKHRRSHENTRSYVCPKCAVGFNRRDGLCRHAMSMHGMTSGELNVLCTS